MTAISWTNVTSWILELDRGKGIPHEGNYSSFLEIQEKRLKQESSEEAAQHVPSRASCNDQAIAQGGQAKSKPASTPMRNCSPRVRNSARARPDHDSHRRTAGRCGDRGGKSRQGLWRPLLYENVNFNLPPGGIVGVIGANGAGKTTLFRMLTGQESPTPAPSRSAPRADRLCRPVARCAGSQEECLGGISGGTIFWNSAKTKVNSRAYVGASPSRRRSTEKGRPIVRRRAQPGASGQDAEIGANLLLLEEPTNDLEWIRCAPGIGLEDSPAAPLIISHDRWFWTASPPICCL